MPNHQMKLTGRASRRGRRDACIWRADRRRSRIGAVVGRISSWSPCDGRGRLSPHRGWKVHTFLKIPRWADASAPSPFLPLGQVPRPSQGGHDEYQTAEADRGRQPGFPSFNVLAGGPGSLAERSAPQRRFAGCAFWLAAAHSSPTMARGFPSRTVLCPLPLEQK